MPFYDTPPRVTDLLAKLSEEQRRSGANRRVENAQISQGGITIVAPDGTVVGRVGELVDGSFGISSFDSEGHEQTLKATADAVKTATEEVEQARVDIDAAAAEVESILEALPTKADKAYADEIKGVADAAKASAATAIDDAAAANSAASTAQEAADDASEAALAAAGIANSKGRVYYGTTAPAADPNGLWIDQTGGANTPKRHNGSAWVAVPDAGIQAAADAAATAKGVADTALANAATADGKAVAAAAQAATAISNAATAHGIATDAATAASAASDAADLAQATATSAQGVADSATSIGNAAAQEAADALEAAGLAQTSANSAGTAASTAQSAANAAQSTANAANTLAGQAKTIGENAATAAANAVSTIDAVSDDLEVVENLLPSKADISYVQSRGTDLVTNGTGFLGNNYNFSTFTHDGTDAPSGSRGSFYTALPSASRFNDEFIPVDMGKRYVLSAWVRQRTPGVTSRFYIGLAPYDAQGAQISPQMYAYFGNTMTTLAADLKPGDTTVTLTDGSNWKTTADIASQKYLGIWDYTDANGRLWEPGTYTRRYPLFTSRNGNVLTLAAPWNGELTPAGTAVSNNIAGGSYMYTTASNQVAQPEWTQYSSADISGHVGHIGGIHDGSTATAATTKFPAATASVRILFLVNREAVGGVSAQAFAGLSLSDASAANAKADAAALAAAAAHTLATTGKSTADTALASANGKNKVTYSVNIPSDTANPGTTIGDLWYQVSGPNYRNTIGIWRWNGAVWLPVEMSHQVLGSVDAAKITTGTLDAARIGANAITAGKINADAVTSREIAADAVTATEIKALAVQAGHLAADSVVAGKIAANAVVAGNVAANAVVAGNIAANAVTAGTIAANAVTATKILAGEIGTAHLAAEAVTAAKIKAGEVTAGKLAANSVVAGNIAANAVTAGTVAANAILAGNIKALEIGTGHLAANAVSAEKIAALAVTTEKLAAGAVVAEKIAAGAITAVKIDAEAITSEKLAAGAVDGTIITGATIRTSATNPRLELTGTSFSGYGASGPQWVRLDQTGLRTYYTGTGQVAQWLRSGSGGLGSEAALVSYRSNGTLASIVSESGLTTFQTSGSGTSLAVGRGVGGNAGIWLYREDGTLSSRITTSGLRTKHLDGTTDSVIIGRDTNGDSGLWLYRGDGSKSSQITQSGIYTNRADGSKGVWLTDDGLWMYRTNGTQLLRMGQGVGLRTTRSDGTDHIGILDNGIYGFRTDGSNAFLLQGGTPTAPSGMWFQWGPDNYPFRVTYDHTQAVRSRIWSDGELGLFGGGVHGFSVTAAGAVLLNYAYLYSITSTGGSANIARAADGRLYIVGSMNALKLDQETIDLDTAEAVLDLTPKTWRDKGEVGEDPDTETRYAGFVAEEVIATSNAHGGALDALVSETSAMGTAMVGVNYDRIAAYLVPIIRNQRDQIADLYNRITELERAQND